MYVTGIYTLYETPNGHKFAEWKSPGNSLGRGISLGRARAYLQVPGYGPVKVRAGGDSGKRETGPGGEGLAYIYGETITSGRDTGLE